MSKITRRSVLSFIPGLAFLSSFFSPNISKAEVSNREPLIIDGQLIGYWVQHFGWIKSSRLRYPPLEYRLGILVAEKPVSTGFIAYQGKFLVVEQKSKIGHGMIFLKGFGDEGLESIKMNVWEKKIEYGWGDNNIGTVRV
jgi:hypothetical protein